jgi:uncharacterized protein (UPF0332 family)
MTKEIMEKARKALASARILLGAGDTDGATNRAYYAMFDSTMAALAWAGIGSVQDQPKTHGGLIGSFGLHLVQSGRLPAELGRSLNRVHELRLIPTGEIVDFSNDFAGWYRARGWWGGRALNQDSYQRPCTVRTVRH